MIGKTKGENALANACIAINRDDFAGKAPRSCAPRNGRADQPEADQRKAIEGHHVMHLPRNQL
jgi:hypothetical protein